MHKHGTDYLHSNQLKVISENAATIADCLKIEKYMYNK